MPPASDPAQNPYWKRDVRRAYPQLSVITQTELSSLLVEHSGIPVYAPAFSPNLVVLLSIVWEPWLRKRQ